MKDEQGRDNPLEVRAEIHGACAIHRAQTKDHHQGWTITHLHTGLAMCFVKDKNEARKIAQFAWRSCCLELRLKTKEEVLAAIPKWLPRWMRRCRREQRFMDPKPFMESKL